MAHPISLENASHLFQRGDDPAAPKAFNQILSSNLSSPPGLYGSTLFPEELNRILNALQAYKRAFKLEPERWQDDIAIVQLFEKIGKFEAALKQARLPSAHIATSDDNIMRLLLDLQDSSVLHLNTTSPLMLSVHAGLGSRFESETLRSNLRVVRNFSQLPVEIATDILAEAAAEDEHTIFLLMRVCRSWRTLIVHNPAFWDTLVLTDKTNEKHVKMRLARSKGIIKHLRIHTMLMGCPFVSEFLRSPDAFRGVAWCQLQSLCIIFSAGFGSQICWLDKDDVSQLRIKKLEFICEEKVSRPRISQSGWYAWEALGCCIPDRVWADLTPEGYSSITSLTFEGVTLQWPKLKGFTSLRSLTVRQCFLTSPSIVAMFPMLRVNSSLRKLVLDSKWNSSQQDADEGKLPLQLSFLRHLEIAGKESFIFFSVVKMPNLRVLHLSDVSSSSILGNPVADAILLLLDDPTAYSLEELCIDRCEFSTNAITALLHRTHNLSTFKINRHRHSVNPIIAELAATHGEFPCCCRQLQHIDISLNERHTDWLKLRALVEVHTSGYTHKPRATRYAPTATRASLPLPIRTLVLDRLPMDGQSWAEALDWFIANVDVVTLASVTGYASVTHTQGSKHSNTHGSIVED